jgi:hypothetical protein
MRVLQLFLLLLLTMTLSGCQLAGDIFKAGAWVGALMVVVVIGIIGFIAMKIRG